eukprot:3845805-Prymnesium_polylepis.1
MLVGLTGAQPGRWAAGRASKALAEEACGALIDVDASQKGWARHAAAHDTASCAPPAPLGGCRKPMRQSGTAPDELS